MPTSKSPTKRLRFPQPVTNDSLVAAGVASEAGRLCLSESQIEPILELDLTAVDMRGSKLVPSEGGGPGRVATLGGRSSRIAASDLSALSARDASIGGTFSRTLFRDVRLTSCQLEGTWSDCDWTGATLPSTQLRGTFVRCVFRDVGATALAARDAVFEDCVFEDVDLTRASFERCRFVRTTFVHAKVDGVSVIASDFEGGDVGPLMRAHAQYLMWAVALRAKLMKGVGHFTLQLVVATASSRRKLQEDLPLVDPSPRHVAQACLRAIETAMAAHSEADGELRIDVMEQCVGHVGHAGPDTALQAMRDELRTLAG